jgi:hypothetical protein
VKRISNGAGPIPRPPTYGIEKPFEKDNEAFILYYCKIKNGGRSRNMELFNIDENKIKEIETTLVLPQMNRRKLTITAISAEADAASFRHFRRAIRHVAQERPRLLFKIFWLCTQDRLV